MEHKPLGQLLVLQTALEYLLQQGGIRLSGDEPKDYDPKGFHVGPREGHYFKPGEREAGGKEVEIVQAPEAESSELDLTEKLPPINQTKPEGVPNWLETPDGVRAMGDSIPRYWYHRPPGHVAEGTSSGGLQAYNMNPNEIESTSGFYSGKPESDQFLWMSPTSRMAEGEFVLDITKLNNADMRFTGQAEGNLLHRGDISPEGIVHRPTPEAQQGEEEEVDFDNAYDPDDEDYDEEADFDEEAAGMPEAQYNAIGQADSLHDGAQTAGWGSDVEVEDDHFSPEGEQSGPQGYAHEVKEYAKQVQEESGILIIGGPTGNEPAKEVYEHHGLEVGHMGGNPITLTHIKDYIEAKGGKAPDAPWETTMTEKSFNLSKLLVLESALEHLAKATLKGEHPERDSEEFVFQKSMKNVVKVGDVDIPVEIALDPVRGLSGRGSMNPGTGMLFRMVNARDFWMKDMRFPLDIIWINDKREVVDISENLPIPTPASHSLPLYSPKRLAVYALEINGGEAKALGINIGDAVEINVS
jgi:uncharacterized membrane protein (UPF0127 family)